MWKTCSASLINRQMQIQTIKGSHFIPGRMAIIEKIEESISKDVMGVQIGSVTMEKLCGCLKIKSEQPFDLAGPPLSIYPKEMRSVSQRYNIPHIHCSIIHK